MLRGVRIGAGIVIVLVGAATLVYGAPVSLKTGRADFATGLLCGVAATVLIALGSLLIDPGLRDEYRR